MPNRATIVEELKGRELSAVTFVQDYLQLQFDGLYLNIFVWPKVMAPGASVTFEMPGYRDKLCDQIGKAVGGVAVEMNKDFQLFFTDGSIVAVSLLPSARTGPEAVVFQDGKGGFGVW